MKIGMLGPIAWRTPPRHYGAWETVVGNLTEGKFVCRRHQRRFIADDYVNAAIVGFSSLGHSDNLGVIRGCTPCSRRTWIAPDIHAVAIPAGVQHDIYAYGDTALRLLSFFPTSVVESTFQDAVMPIGGNVLSSQLRTPVLREITPDELPPELQHLAGGEPPPDEG